MKESLPGRGPQSEEPPAQVPPAQVPPKKAAPSTAASPAQAPAAPEEPDALDAPEAPAAPVVPPPPVVAVVSPDAMKAWIRVAPPAPREERAPLTLKIVLAALRAERVAFGIKHDAIERFCARPAYNTNVLVAEGRAPEHGDDAAIDYQFEIEPVAKVKKADEQDRVDYKELNLIQNVSEGDLLAVRTPPTRGVSGVNVLDERIAAEPGKDRKLLAGKNVRLSDDGNQLFAVVSGGAYLMGGKVTVSRVHLVPGSVGVTTGNITFSGTVEVIGAVEDGFTVKAAEDIIIRGSVGRAVLEAGRNITIRGGIVGGNEGRISCGGDLNAKFIQEADVTAVGNVIVYDVVMHSHVKCGGSVQVGFSGTKKGSIVGGQIRAFKHVFCKTLGSPMSTKTVVDVGVKPALLARMEELQADIVRDRQNFENISKGLASLEQLKERLEGALPPDKEKILESLRMGHQSLKAKLGENATEFKRLQEEVAVKPNSVVSVYDELYPGVKVTIGPSVYYTTKPEKYLTLKLDAGEISKHTYTALGMPEET